MTATAKRWKDKEWRYVRSEATDLHATFRRILLIVLLVSGVMLLV